MQQIDVNNAFLNGFLDRNVNGAGRVRVVTIRYPHRLLYLLPVPTTYPRGYLLSMF